MKATLKKLFLPIPENDHTPHLLQQTAMGFMLLLILLSFAATNLQVLLWQSSSWLVGAVLPAVVVDLTNEERTEAALPNLVRNKTLDEAARKKAQHMADNEYFAHYSPDNISPWYWFEDAGYVYAYAGENLAIHFSDSADVVDAWMDSPGHRANIVSGVYSEIGVGTARGTFEGHDTVYVVQLFGTPAVPLAVAVPPKPVPTPVPSFAGTVTTNDREASPDPLSETVPNTDEEDVADDTTLALASENTAEEPLIVRAPEPIAPEVPIAEPSQLSSVPLSETEPRSTLFSGFVATSSGLPVASIGEIGGTTSPAPSLFASAATQPSHLLQALYVTIGSVVLVLLMISISIGLHNARSLQVVYGIGLLMIMSGLFYVHLGLTSAVVIAAPLDATAILYESN